MSNNKAAKLLIALLLLGALGGGGYWAYKQGMFGTKADAGPALPSADLGPAPEPPPQTLPVLGGGLADPNTGAAVSASYFLLEHGAIRAVLELYRPPGIPPDLRGTTVPAGLWAEATGLAVVRVRSSPCPGGECTGTLAYLELDARTIRLFSLKGGLAAFAPPLPGRPVPPAGSPPPWVRALGNFDPSFCWDVSVSDGDLVAGSTVYRRLTADEAKRVR